jgi:hypothetical protein
MKKLFKFEERIPAILIQCYEVEAETEEEAWLMVAEGKGFVDSYTQEDEGEPVGIELYDTEDLP